VAKSYAVTTAYLVVDWNSLIRVDVAVGIAGGEFHEFSSALNLLMFLSEFC
jgi:hypothetical protein